MAISKLVTPSGYNRPSISFGKNIANDNVSKTSSMVPSHDSEVASLIDSMKKINESLSLMQGTASNTVKMSKEILSAMIRFENDISKKFKNITKDITASRSDFIKSLAGIAPILPMAGGAAAAEGVSSRSGNIRDPNFADYGKTSEVPGPASAILPAVAAAVVGAGAGAAVKGAGTAIAEGAGKTIAKGAGETAAEVGAKNITKGAGEAAAESAIPKGAPEAKPAEPPKTVTKDTAKEVADMKAKNPELTSKQALEEIKAREAPTPEVKAPAGEPVKVTPTAPEAVAGAPEKKGAKAALSDIKAAVGKRIGGSLERMAGLGAKALPFGIGTAIGSIFGAMRWWEGDTKGAIAEVGLGAASAFPVAGTAIAIAGQTAMMGRDVYNEVYGDEKNKFPFDDDLKNDPAMVGQRMLDIKDMLQEEITKAAEANQASREETTAAMEGAGRKLGGAAAQQPAKVGGGMTAAGATTANATIDEKKAFIADKTKGKMTFPEWKAKKDAENAATDPSKAPPGTPAATTPDAGAVQGPPAPGSQGSGDGVMNEGQDTDASKNKPPGAPEATGAATTTPPAPSETPTPPAASQNPTVINNTQTNNTSGTASGEKTSRPNFPMTAQNDALTKYMQSQMMKDHA